MSGTDTAPGRSRRSPDKRRAILDGARVTFAREGYTRASIDTIAAAADVSTRTLYNHFGDKARLFEEVIQSSATEVAESQIALIEAHLGEVTDVESAIIGFACAWARPTPEFADHFALVQQIRAEVGHLPPAVLNAWQEAGPRRVRRELARRLEELADRGLLRVADPERAAFHLATLAAAEVESRNYRGVFPISDADVAELATAGARVFLHGYAP
ncbi:TetR/AcrR family transcriptional regulator [Actinoallomurus iriomotensis]|uniref:Transcriptional regulator n=1 Tax=Actinoallomurus iriomotensis TaxID=478107 RepID=A0A9W6VRH1_9ACTN|nr:TetR/AcrR family transcriptional regulator [Actinoallomurus iriomotensis]GLY76959.1 transcriptional regulator [Actinoallomurus iriomotensis]